MCHRVGEDGGSRSCSVSHKEAGKGRIRGERAVKSPLMGNGLELKGIVLHTERQTDNSIVNPAQTNCFLNTVIHLPKRCVVSLSYDNGGDDDMCHTGHRLACLNSVSHECEPIFRWRDDDENS